MTLLLPYKSNSHLLKITETFCILHIVLSSTLHIQHPTNYFCILLHKIVISLDIPPFEMKIHLINNTHRIPGLITQIIQYNLVNIFSIDFLSRLFFKIFWFYIVCKVGAQHVKCCTYITKNDISSSFLPKKCKNVADCWNS